MEQAHDTRRLQSPLLPLVVISAGTFPSEQYSGNKYFPSRTFSVRRESSQTVIEIANPNIFHHYKCGTFLWQGLGADISGALLP